MSVQGVAISPPKAAGGVIRATVNLVAGIAAGTSIPMDLKWNPDAAVEKLITIPANEEWELKDLYTSTNYAGANGAIASAQLRIKKDADRILDYSEIVGSVWVGNPGRPNGLHANLTYAGASQMTFDLITGDVVTPTLDDDPREYLQKQFEIMSEMGIIPDQKEEREAFKLDIKRELMKNFIRNNSNDPRTPIGSVLILIPYEKHSM